MDAQSFLEDNQNNESDMDLEETLALKRTNHEKLIRNMDKAIRNEMLKYEEAEFYIRLQSECFNLYPIVVKALALQIIDNKRRSIFCSIVKGHKLKTSGWLSQANTGRNSNRIPFYRMRIATQD